MKESTYFICALIPAVLWIWYFYRHDKGEREPARLLILAAFLGAVAVIPASFLENLFTQSARPLLLSEAKDFPISLLSTFWFFIILNLIIVSIVEEIAKFLAIRLTIYNSKYFNEVSDGIIYMVAAAFGFAAFENFLYFLNFGNNVIFARSLFTPLFHASASAIVGHYLGLAKWNKCYKRKIYIGLICSIILHTVYNFLGFYPQFSGKIIGYTMRFLVIILLVLSGKWMLDKFRETENIDDKYSLNNK